MAKTVKKLPARDDSPPAKASRVTKTYVTPETIQPTHVIKQEKAR